MNSGQQAEQLAARYLQQCGLKLLDSNYYCRFGEIDLIRRDGDFLEFAEVRKRSSMGFGGPAGRIGSHKQQRLILTARHYIASIACALPCRFDALLLDARNNIAWLKNAFEV